MTTDEADLRLRLDDVELRVGERVLFRAISADVRAGESLAIVGPSGVGKSTLLAAIAGLIPPSHGTIRLARRRTEAPVDWIVQSTPLLLRRSAVDNVALAAEIAGRSRDDAEIRGLQALASVGLAERGTVPCYRLSGGEKQRVAVARALVADSDVVLADEPTASLDPVSRDHVSAALQRVCARGAIVVIATHDADVAASCLHRLELRAHEVAA